MKSQLAAQLSFDPGLRAHPFAAGEAGLFTLANTLAKYTLPLEGHEALAQALAVRFSIPAPAVVRNQRLTSKLGRYLSRGIIEMGSGITNIETLVHEFAHHLAHTRAATAWISAHGREFNLALRDSLLATFEILEIEPPSWTPLVELEYRFRPGVRVQVNPYRQDQKPWLGHVQGYTARKVRVIRHEPGHPHHGWLYAVPEQFLVEAPPIDLSGLDLDLDLDLDELGGLTR